MVDAGFLSKGLVLVTLVVALAGCDPGATAVVDAGGVAFLGHSYFLTQRAEDWNAAEAESVARGGHLAAVGSQAEQDFLTATFCHAAFPLWIGATDVGHKGTFAWSSGEPLAYTSWSSGEPNDWTGDEDYVAMNWHFAEGNDVRGKWNDAPLPGTKGYGGTTDGPYLGVIEVP